jgi:hypothetical protein
MAPLPKKKEDEIQWIEIDKLREDQLFVGEPSQRVFDWTAPGIRTRQS